MEFEELIIDDELENETAGRPAEEAAAKEASVETETPEETAVEETEADEIVAEKAEAEKTTAEDTAEVIEELDLEDRPAEMVMAEDDHTKAQSAENEAAEAIEELDLKDRPAETDVAEDGHTKEQSAENEAAEAIEELDLKDQPAETDATEEEHTKGQSADNEAAEAIEELDLEDGPSETDAAKEDQTKELSAENETSEVIEELALGEQPAETAPAEKTAEDTSAAGQAEQITENGSGIVRPVLLGLFFAVLLAAAYIYGVDYYGTHFLPNTLISGVDVGELTAEEAKEKLATAYDDSVFRFTGRDGTEEELDISEASPERDYEGIGGILSAQDRKGWIFSRKPVKESELPYRGTFDTAGLERALDRSVLLDPEQSVHPEDAYMTFDEGEGHYVIIPEVPGTTVDRQIVVPVMEKILRQGGNSLDLEEIGSYISPEILSDNEELNRRTNTLNTLQDLHAGVDMGADVQETLSGEQLLELISEDGAVEAYVTGLRDRYDTYNTEEKRLFETQDGNYKLISAAWGWRMDEEKTLEAMRAMVDQAAVKIGLGPLPEAGEESGNAAETPAADVTEEGEVPNPYMIEAVWKNKAVVHHRRLDYGSMYAEVDLTHQTVYVIRDGEVIFTSPCVSGRMTKGRMTPEGFYDIKLKQTNKVLTGYKPDGSVDYRSPVSYWMPFNGGIGFHDATWRGSFGGTIYVYSGSHGCINLPFSRAKELYDIVYKGMPVIVYY